MFNGVSDVVLDKTKDYLIGVAISMIFLAVYMSVFAVFRGLDETKKCLHLTVIINLLHFIASFVFINIMHLDILGSTLSLNLARFVGGAAAVFMLLSPKSVLHVQIKHIFCIDKKILWQIFRVGIPFCMGYKNICLMEKISLWCMVGKGNNLNIIQIFLLKGQSYINKALTFLL